MADRVIGWAYVVVGLGVGVALVFGSEAPLSIDWMGMIAGKLVEGLWRGSPVLCLFGVFAAGGAVGFRLAKREADQGHPSK